MVVDDQGRLSKLGRQSLSVLSWGDVAHGSVDGDGPGVEAPHHFAHLLPVAEGVTAPILGNILLEETTAGLQHLFQWINSPLLPEEWKPE